MLHDMMLGACSERVRTHDDAGWGQTTHRGEASIRRGETTDDAMDIEGDSTR